MLLFCQRRGNYSPQQWECLCRYVQYYEAIIAEQQIPEAQEVFVSSVSVSGYSSHQLARLVLVISVRCPQLGTMQHAATWKSTESEWHLYQAAKSSPKEQSCELKDMPAIRRQSIVWWRVKLQRVWQLWYLQYSLWLAICQYYLMMYIALADYLGDIHFRLTRLFVAERHKICCQSIIDEDFTVIL